MPFDVNSIPLNPPTDGPDSPSPSGQPSILGRVGELVTGNAAALAMGLTKDPFVGGALDLISSEYPEAAPEHIQQMLEETANVPGHKFFETVGKFLPAFATGAAAMSVGRAAGTAVAERLLPEAAAYLGRGAGEAFVAMPTGLRAAQIAGTSLGAGGDVFAREKVQGADTVDALKAAGLATALTGGVETTLSAGSRLLFGRQRNVAELIDRVNPDREAIAAPMRDRVAEIDRTISANRTSLTPGLTQPQLQSLLQERSTLLSRLDAFPTSPISAASRQMDDSAKQFYLESKELERQAQNALAHGDEVRAGELTRRAEARKYASNNAGRVATFLRNPQNDPHLPQFYLDIPSGGAKDSTFLGITIPAATKDFLYQLKTRLIESPETTARREGIVLTRVTQDLYEANRQARSLGVLYMRDMDQQFSVLAKHMGVRWSALRDTKWASPLVKLWETPGEGLAGIERTYGRETARAWATIMDKADRMYSLIRTMGVVPQMSPQLKQEMAVENWFPHFFRRTPDQIKDQAIRKVIEFAASRGEDITWAEAQSRLIQLSEELNMGMKRVGSIDFNRKFPGTLEHKAQFFDLETDPRRALLEYGNGIAHRYAWGRVFGPNMELKEPLLEAAVKEGANPTIATEMLNHLLGVKYHNQAMYQSARFLTNLQIMSKLGLAFIPNAAQSTNNALLVGMKNSMAGLWQHIRGVDRDNINHALGAWQGVADSIQDVILGQDKGGPLDWAVRHFLSGTTFAKSEEFNRMLSAATGQYVIRDTVGKLVAGRLRGDTLARAERMMDQFDINLQGIALRARSRGMLGQPLSTQQIDDLIGGPNALYRGINAAAKKLQFIPDSTRLPQWWTHPVGRVVFQFKSFAFNQMKFLRDSVFREVEQGNLAPLFSMLSIYPATGELVQNALSAFSGKERPNGIRRYAENMVSMGAFGLAYTAALSMAYNDGAGWLLGPTFSDAMNYTQALFRPEPFNAVMEKVSRTPTFQLGRGLAHTAGGAGRLGVHAVTQLYDHVTGPVGDSGPPPLTPGQLRDHLRR